MLKKIILERELADLRMQCLHIDRWLDSPPSLSKEIGCSGEELVLPRGDLAGVYIKALRQLGKRPSFRTAARATLALKAGAWVRRDRFDIWNSLAVDEISSGKPACPLILPVQKIGTTSAISAYCAAQPVRSAEDLVNRSGYVRRSVDRWCGRVGLHSAKWVVSTASLIRAYSEVRENKRSSTDAAFLGGFSSLKALKHNAMLLVGMPFRNLVAEVEPDDFLAKIR